MARAGDLGSLFYSLELEIAKFRDGLNKADKLARERSQKMSKAFNTTKRAVVGLGSALAALGVSALIKSSLDAADKIGKLSQRLGISTEALSQYQHVAKLTGVEFNTMTMGFQRMTRRVAEAAQGTGEAKNALKELNVSAEKLVQLSPDKQFEVLADAIKKVKNPADQVRLAMKLFDSEGVALIQTMQGGSESIRAMREEADRLGKTLTEEGANAAAKAKDEMAKLNAAVSGFAQATAIAVAGPLAAFLGYMTDDLIPTIGQAIRDFAVWLGLMQRTKTEQARHELTLLIQEFERLHKEVEHYEEEIAKANHQQERFEQELAKTKKAIQENWNAQNKAREAIKATLDPTKDLKQLYADVTAGLEDMETATGKVTDTQKTYREELRRMQHQLDSVPDKIRDLYNAMAQGEISAKLFKKELERLEKQFGEVEVAVKDLKDEVHELGPEFTNALAEVDQQLQESKKLWDAVIEEFGRGVFDSWVGFWKDALSGSIDSFKDFINAILEQFKNMIAQMIALWTSSKIFEFLGFNIAGVPSASVGGGIAGSIAGGAIGKVAKGAFGKIAGIFGGGGGAAIATGLGSVAVPTGAVAGTLGPIFVGQPIGAGVAAAPAAPASGGLLASAAANPAVAAAIAALAIFAGTKVFGGGRSKAQILADELKEVAASVDQVKADAPAMFKLFEDTSAKFLGGGFRSQFLDFGSNAAAEAFANYARTVSDLGIDVQDTFVRLIDQKAKLEDTSTWISGVDDLVKRYDSMREEVTEIFQTLSGDALSQLAVIQLDAENVAQVMADGFVSSSESASLGIRGLGDVSADVFRQLVVDVQSSFSEIELNSEKVTDALADNFVTAAELAALGIHGLGGMAADTFRSIVANARAAAEAAQQVGASVGGPTPSLGPLPQISAPPPRQRADFQAALGGAHGLSFLMRGGGVDGTNVRVSGGERVRVETPSQQRAMIDLLTQILTVLTKQQRDFNRMMANA